MKVKKRRIVAFLLSLIMAVAGLAFTPSQVAAYGYTPNMYSPLSEIVATTTTPSSIQIMGWQLNATADWAWLPIAGTLDMSVIQTGELLVVARMYDEYGEFAHYVNDITISGGIEGDRIVRRDGAQAMYYYYRFIEFSPTQQTRAITVTAHCGTVANITGTATFIVAPPTPSVPTSLDIFSGASDIVALGTGLNVYAGCNKFL